MMSPQVAILCIGNEVVDGRIVNTNAAWLSEQLKEAGFSPHLVTTCRDIQSEIIDILSFLSERSSHIITSGGLGPTSDDLTRQAISEFLNKPLIENTVEIEKLEKLYREKGRALDLNSRVQAHFPEGATIINNPVGTAPGFSNQSPSGHTIFSLPGVPKELFRLFQDSVLPTLKSLEASTLQKTGAHYFHCFGIPESVAGKTVDSLNISPEITVGFRPHFPELEIRLETTADNPGLSKSITQIREELSKYIFSEKRKASLPTLTHEILLEHDKTISVAESCTGGLLGKLLTNESGSSHYFLGGYITYSNQLKIELLGVSEKTLFTHGAVSLETAKEMAAGTRQKTNSDIALSITGVAGPNGGTEEKPIGLFYVGLATSNQVQAFKFFLPFDRDYIRIYAAYSALDTLRRTLLGLPSFIGKAEYLL